MIGLLVLGQNIDSTTNRVSNRITYKSYLQGTYLYYCSQVILNLRQINKK